MDDETINKNIKAFFGELKNKTNRILFILIFVFIGLIIAMFVTKSIHDNKPHVPNTPESVEPTNPDDEDWPDDSAKTRIYNNQIMADVNNTTAGISEYQSRNNGMIPTDYDTLKRAYREYMKPLLSRDYKYDICDFAKGNCKTPDKLTWKDDKLTLYFALHAVCDTETKSLIPSTSARRVAVYTHLRGESNGIYCLNNI